jgi:hypothetical protein
MYPFISPGYTACPFTPTLYTFLLYFPVGFLLSFTRFYSISILRGKATPEAAAKVTGPQHKYFNGRGYGPTA